MKPAQTFKAFEHMALRDVLLGLLFVLACTAPLKAQQHEMLLFSFRTKGHRTVSFHLDTVQRTLIFREKVKKKTIFQLVDDLQDSLEVFHYGFYHRPGGIENAGLEISELSFQSNDQEFTIAVIWSAEEEGTAISYTKTDQRTGKKRYWPARISTVDGSIHDLHGLDLLPLRDL